MITSQTYAELDSTRKNLISMYTIVSIRDLLKFQTGDFSHREPDFQAFSTKRMPQESKILGEWMVLWVPVILPIVQTFHRNSSGQDSNKGSDKSWHLLST